MCVGLAGFAPPFLEIAHVGKDQVLSVAGSNDGALHDRFCDPACDCRHASPILRIQ